MDPRPWESALAASADPARAGSHLRLLAGTRPDIATALAGFGHESRRILVSLLAGSRALTDLLLHHPDWVLAFRDPAHFLHPRRREGLVREIDPWLAPALDRGETETGLDRLHDFRLREQLRIAARDLARLGTSREIMLELSNAADAFLAGVLAVVNRRIAARLGTPFHRAADGSWRPTGFCVLGLGKLGGQELNYSSDVDLLLVYAEEGGTWRRPPGKRRKTGQVVSNHVFFRRLSEEFLREASGRGVDAGGLRVDLRLRPEGESGPLARSLESYENYYAACGQPWERLMLLKARHVAGDESLAEEFLELIQPFRQPRAVGLGLLDDMAELKARTEREAVKPGELERNIKLGRGGIREIEFVAQVLQVLHGARHPFLQTTRTLDALEKLSNHRLLPAADVARLQAAYPFLRDVEHRLQMEDQRPTHTLPNSPGDLARLARSMGFPDAAGFGRTLRRHTSHVRRVYERILGGGERKSGPASPGPGDFTGEARAWLELLASRGFRDPGRALRLFQEFVEGPDFVHLSHRTRDLGRQLLGRFLELCPGGNSGPRQRRPRFVLSDPDRVLTRLGAYLQAYGARSSLVELWHARPASFEHLIKLFDRSEFLAEIVIRSPDLVDELESGGHLRRRKTAGQTHAELGHGLADRDPHLWLRRYFRTESVRLGLRDILGIVDLPAMAGELTALAEACVRHALEIVLCRHRFRMAPFAAIALGKFGGSELDYGSDLDLVFVCPDRPANLPKLQRMAAEFIDLLGSRTAEGRVFDVDARLRPDGEKGPLVQPMAAHEAYYRSRAGLWEIQALTRARFIAGHSSTGTAFEHLCRRLTDFRNPSLPLAAFGPDWKDRIGRMRRRIECERTPPGMGSLAFKTGAGGLMDAEFIAQSMAMEHGWFLPNTLASLRRIGDLGLIPARHCDRLIQHFLQLRRVEAILRRWSYAGEDVLPSEAEAQFRVAIRCGFSDASGFLSDLVRRRRELRSIYERFLPSPVGTPASRTSNPPAIRGPEKP